MSTIEHGVG